MKSPQEQDENLTSYPRSVPNYDQELKSGIIRHQDQVVVDVKKDEQSCAQNSVSWSGKITPTQLMKSLQAVMSDLDKEHVNSSVDLSLSLSTGSSSVLLDLEQLRLSCCTTTSTSSCIRSAYQFKRKYPHKEEECGIDLDLRLGPPRKKIKRELSPLPTAEIHQPLVQVKSGPADDIVIDDATAVVVAAVPEHVMIDPWVIKKKITRSDINGSARLLIPVESFHEHIRKKVENYLGMIESEEGLPVMIYDWDEGSTHSLKFKWWKSSKGYIFNGGWTTKFVKRRQLKVGDQIGLWCSDDCAYLGGPTNVGFYFSVLEKAATAVQN